MTAKLLSVIAGLTLCSVASAYGQSVPDAFVDRFDMLRQSRWQISNGWSNGEGYGCAWRALDAKAEGGSLTLSIEQLATGGKPYTCAELQSRRRYGFGLYEYKVTPAVGGGITTTFFLMARDENKPTSLITVNLVGNDPSRVTFYVGTGPSASRTVDLPASVRGPAIPMAINWRKDAVQFYVGGELVHEVKPAETPIPQDPMVIYLSAFNKTDGSFGPFDPAAVPAQAVFQEVAFTPAGAPCQFPASLVCHLAASN